MQTIFTVSYFKSERGQVACHSNIASARKFAKEGATFGATKTIAWVGAQDRKDAEIDLATGKRI